MVILRRTELMKIIIIQLRKADNSINKGQIIISLFKVNKFKQNSICADYKQYAFQE
jgi:hypothetical protein